MNSAVYDALFECLAKRRRRVVLTYLLTSRTQSAAVEDLVTAVIETESHSSSPDPESVVITLDHIHLPLLADTGLIEYERDRGIVTTTSRITDIEPYLDVMQNADRLDGITGERTGGDE